MSRDRFAELQVEFEAGLTKGFDVSKNEYGGYDSNMTRGCWKSWLAGRNARNAEINDLRAQLELNDAKVGTLREALGGMSQAITAAMNFFEENTTGNAIKFGMAYERGMTALAAADILDGGNS